MKKLAFVWIILAFSAICFDSANAQQVKLQLVQSSDAIVPDMPYILLLSLNNQGAFIDSAQIFVALDIGTGDYWFWPSWCHYPPATDWVDADITSGYEDRMIIPYFIWPSGCGHGDLQFISAVLAGGELVSNVAVTSLSWSETLPGYEFIPAGAFTMGSPQSEMCRSSDEVQHTVNLTHGFFIQRTEVTQSQWIEVFGLNPSYFVGMQRPVEQVSFIDCCIYCNRLSAAEGLLPCYYSDPAYNTILDGTPPVTSGEVYWYQGAFGYRLPTEAEWEYACRAGTNTSYNSAQNATSCGEDPRLDPLGWYAYNSNTGSGDGTQTVGHKEANAWNLSDMHGNVAEICWDWDGDYPAGDATDPTGPDSGSVRIARGGSWIAEAEECRSPRRSACSAYDGISLQGFRPVRSGSYN